ncbi:MAG TPA: VWA domain-containing protein, partial [Thermoanaerobaculia bacterium]|nr:VWA domain-containing protein [Thermoanaerobaculia bacterium]
AEGSVPEAAGAVRILPPRRDVAPHLFIVEVEARPPVRRVEFWVEGKKLMTRNAPPYRAEVDLGALPRRVEVRAIGYDARGRYVDADAFVVNERETPLEIRITRTVTPDGVAHFRVSLQNAKGRAIRSVAFYAGKRRLVEWKEPPYAIDIPAERLAGAEFVRASATDETGYEATDILFLAGDRYSDRVDVHLIELPLGVTDAAGNPITDLGQSEVHVFEEGKPQKISSFSLASNLPLSIGLVIDHSGSMKPRMAAAKEAAAEFLRSVIKGQDRAFVASFAFEPSKVAPFTSDIASLARQVEAIPEPSGGTSLHDAIITGLYRFRSIEGRKALVVLTDGEDTTSRIGYEELLTYVRAARVPIYFIAIGLGITDLSGRAKIHSLAAETGAAAFFVRGTGELKETYRRLEADLRTQYLVSYYAESVANDTKYRAVEVKVDRPDANVRSIRGYIP